MSPVAIHPKPRVFSLHKLDDGSASLARHLFEYTEPGMKGWEDWKSLAEGIMVRGNALTANEIAQFGPQLRFVSKHGVGVDRFDMRALKEKGVVVMNTPGVNAGAVAELALGLAMSVARQIPLIDRRIRAGEIVTKAEAGALGIQLVGRTLGLVGGGNIGFRLGKMFHGAFNGKIVIYDPYLTHSMAEVWAEAIPPSHLHRATTLGEMLEASDVISLHVPLLPSTENLISYSELKIMKPNAILVNTARGGIVNEEDLFRALEEGLIMGAGLDAFVYEPPTLSSYPKLVTHPRVISTPHVGAACPDVITITAVSVIEHLAEALQGRTPRDVVNVP